MNLKSIMLNETSQTQEVMIQFILNSKRQNYRDRNHISGCQGAGKGIDLTINDHEETF